MVSCRFLTCSDQIYPMVWTLDLCGITCNYTKESFGAPFAITCSFLLILKVNTFKKLIGKVVLLVSSNSMFFCYLKFISANIVLDFSLVFFHFYSVFPPWFTEETRVASCKSCAFLLYQVQLNLLGLFLQLSITSQNHIAITITWIQSYCCSCKHTF